MEVGFKSDKGLKEATMKMPVLSYCPIKYIL